MNIRRVIVSAVFAFLISTSNIALAAGEDAALFVHHLGNQTIATLAAPDLTLGQRKDQFRGLLRQGFDIPFIGRFVVGRAWRSATVDQQRDYLALYSEFFLQTYASRIGDYSGQTFVVIGARQANAKDFVVRAQIMRPGGQPFNTDWRVRKTNAGYRVIDIMVEGISLAVTQRSEFASVTRRIGLDGLITTLRSRTLNIAEVASLN